MLVNGGSENVMFGLVSFLASRGDISLGDISLLVLVGFVSASAGRPDQVTKEIRYSNQVGAGIIKSSHNPNNRS